MTTTHSTRTTAAATARDVLDDDPTRAPLGPVGASVAFAWRSLVRLRRVPQQAADALFVPVVFTVLFTYLFGGALAGSPDTYLQYLLPGTLVMTVTLMTVFGGVTLNTDVTTGTLDRYRTLPIWQPAIVLGGLVGDIARYLVAGGLVVGLGLLMGFRPDGGPGAALLGIALVVVFAFGLSWVWATIGILMATPQSVSMTSFLVQFPLTFVSNAFVDPATMPDWLRRVVEVNPVSLLITAERHLFAGTATWPDVAWVLASSAAIVLVFAPLTTYLLRRR
jgi:ABC-2 type transport system permease protein